MLMDGYIGLWISAQKLAACDATGRVKAIQNTIRVINLRGLGTLAYQPCQYFKDLACLGLSQYP